VSRAKLIGSSAEIAVDSLAWEIIAGSEVRALDDGGGGALLKEALFQRDDTRIGVLMVGFTLPALPESLNSTPRDPGEAGEECGMRNRALLVRGIPLASPSIVYYENCVASHASA